MERVAVFIDGNNFYFGLRKLFGKEKRLKNFKFNKFAKFLVKKRELSGIYYYNARLDKNFNQNKFKSQKDFYKRLRNIPKFHLVLCRLLKRNIKGTNKHYYIIKEDDIHMAVDMVDGSAYNIFDVAILVSGDGDFVPAVHSIKNRNKKVENVYFRGSSSRNLKQHCDNSLELSKDILEKFL